MAELLGLDLDNLCKMAGEGRIPAHRDSGSGGWWYDRDELIAWLRAGPTEP